MHLFTRERLLPRELCELPQFLKFDVGRIA